MFFTFSVRFLIGLEMGIKDLPRIFFFQVYTLHGLVQDRVILCIYALLPDKSEDTYRRFFEEIRNTLDLEHSRQDIMTDFQIAAINAAATFMKGYFFHLSSNLWKQIQRNGLQQRYIDDTEFANTLRMIAALAFVPPDEVEAYFEQYCDHAKNLYDDDCDPVIDCFEYTCIGRFRRNAPRRAPLFAQRLWNMFHRTFNEVVRTNNSIEDWHRSFQATVGTSDPSFWKFMEKLIQEQRLHCVKLLQVLYLAQSKEIQQNWTRLQKFDI